MKLVYTITRYWPAMGGAEVHTHELVRRISRAHDVKLITQLNENRTDWLVGTTIKAPKYIKKYYDDKAEVILINLNQYEKIKLLPFMMAYPVRPLRYQALLGFEHIFKNKIAAMLNGCELIHHIHVGREYLGYISWKIARDKKIPFVFTPLVHPSRFWNNKLFIKLYQGSDALIAMTEHEKEWLIKKGVDKEKVHVIGVGPLISDKYDGIDFKLKNKINGKMVLFLGQKHKYKGYIEILKATKDIWKYYPNTYFVFIGPRTQESNKVFLKYNDTRIIEKDKVNEYEKTSALDACDIFCMPSNQESFGGVFLEAWMFGKPVIACNIPAERELISHGKDGFIVQQDPNEIAQRTVQLLDNEELCKSMGINGKNKVEERYAWEKLVKKTESIYKNLLG